jgi:hypothetical protein
MYLNHKSNAATPFRIVAITKITRRNTVHKKYPGKTLLNKGEKPNNPFLYSQEKILQA